VVDVSGIRQGP